VDFSLKQVKLEKQKQKKEVSILVLVDFSLKLLAKN